MNKFIITFGNQKGGAGKSTSLFHMVITMLYLYPNLSIGVIDVDSAQRTTYNAFKAREQQYNLPMPKYFTFINYSKEDSQRKSHNEESNDLHNTINNMKTDIIFIDTPGTINNLSKESISMCNYLITPMNESIVDIAAILCLDSEEDRIKLGAFGLCVRDVRNEKYAQMSMNNSLKDNFWKWGFLFNRGGFIKQKNKQSVRSLISMVISYVSGIRLGTMHQRVAYTMFARGTTLVDRVEKNDGSPIGNSVQSAYNNLKSIVAMVHSTYQEWNAIKDI